MWQAEPIEQIAYEAEDATQTYETISVNIINLHQVSFSSNGSEAKDNLLFNSIWLI